MITHPYIKTDTGAEGIISRRDLVAWMVRHPDLHVTWQKDTSFCTVSTREPVMWWTHLGHRSDPAGPYPYETRSQFFHHVLRSHCPEGTKVTISRQVT